MGFNYAAFFFFLLVGRSGMTVDQLGTLEVPEITTTAWFTLSSKAHLHCLLAEHLQPTLTPFLVKCIEFQTMNVP